ncbi:DUF2628 domain-containing protein [Diaphorobacter caeni]|uniref:DUF2628 domain-containing protein n=1 Tax=Diaphorobacter caeni TaxID=2784387 RepID=UPI00188F8FB3|nr:DUF2628 domain-containing protein [Diaphorobacter caeni]MBF5002932.1 DUF2628 domain-containing protein [Diaphorobacter caeni]
MSDASNPATTPDPVSNAPVADWHNDPTLSEKWKYRFNFFEKNGVPGMGSPSPQLRAAFKELSFAERVKVNMNFFALFFSFIYFGFFLKMWRQAAIAFGLIVAASIILSIFNLSNGAARGASMGLGVLFGLRANALYYLKRTQGDIGWKFF